MLRSRPITQAAASSGSCITRCLTARCPYWSNTRTPLASSDDDCVPDRRTIRIPIQDYSFIALIVVVSMMPYIGKLGFYSDDWQFLASMELASNKSFLGTFFAVIVHDYYFRP